MEFHRLPVRLGPARAHTGGMLICSYKDFPSAAWRWPRFSPLELAGKCPMRGCQGEHWHDPAFRDTIEALRAVAGKPLKLNSGHRCSVRNLLAGGVPNSRRRIAVNISFRRHMRCTDIPSPQPAENSCELD